MKTPMANNASTLAVRSKAPEPELEEEPVVEEVEVSVVEELAAEVVATVELPVELASAVVDTTEPTETSAASARSVETDAGMFQMSAPTEEHNERANDVALTTSSPEHDRAIHSPTVPDH